jgi:hypothetical protein
VLASKEAIGIARHARGQQPRHTGCAARRVCESRVIRSESESPCELPTRFDVSRECTIFVLCCSLPVQAAERFKSSQAAASGGDGGWRHSSAADFYEQAAAHHVR